MGAAPSTPAAPPPAASEPPIEQQQEQQQPPRVSQRDLPFKPGFYNRRDDAAPCAPQHVELLRCYKDAGSLTFGPCRAEYNAFWECMKHHQPPHKAGGGGGLPPALQHLRDKGPGWLAARVTAVKGLIFGGGGDSSGGGEGASGGGDVASGGGDAAAGEARG